jgi:hypothetical protein
LEARQALLILDSYFDEAVLFCGVNGRNHLRAHRPTEAPSAPARDGSRKLPPGKILLIPELLVGRHEDFKSGCFSQVQ